MEAMTEAGAQMGLPREQAYQLAVATFIGAGELARASPEAPEVLRQRVKLTNGREPSMITMLTTLISVVSAIAVAVWTTYKHFSARSADRRRSDFEAFHKMIESLPQGGTHTISPEAIATDA